MELATMITALPRGELSIGRDPDPRDLLITYPSEPMTMWPISRRVKKPENDDPSLLDRAGDPFEVWARA
jgi:hypothetical protein